MEAVFGQFSKIFSSYGPSVFNGMLVVVTISGQSLVKKLTFQCPCAFPLNVYLALGFIFGPAIALFLLGLMLNNTTWRIVHGCCFRSQLRRPGYERLNVNLQLETTHNFTTMTVNWARVFMQASVAPLAWLIVALLDGGYYECLCAGRYCRFETAKQCENMTSATTTSTSFLATSYRGTYCPPCICGLESSISSMLRSESQLYAWWLLVGSAITVIFVLCSVRIFDKYTYEQYNYSCLYKDVERKAFDDISKDYATKLANRNVQAFFAQQQWSKMDWDIIASLPKSYNPYIFDRARAILDEGVVQDCKYTSLQKWCDKKYETNPLKFPNISGGSGQQPTSSGPPSEEIIAAVVTGSETRRSM